MQSHGHLLAATVSFYLLVDIVSKRNKALMNALLGGFDPVNNIPE